MTRNWRGKLGLLNESINTIDISYRSKVSWAGDYKDFYRAPVLKEPDYLQYRYVSKLAVLADQTTPNQFFPVQLRVSEIEKVLWQQVITDPFESNASDFAAPRILLPIFPAPPSDPRPLLSSRRPSPSPPPARPTPSAVKAAQLNVLGIKLKSINGTITRGRQREEDKIFETQLAKWQLEVNRINELNRQASDRFLAELETDADVKAYHLATAYWSRENEKLRANFDTAVQQWNLHRYEFVEAHESDKTTIASLKADVDAGFTDAIQSASILALRNSRFQNNKTDAAYDADSGILLIDYDLPNFAEIEIVEDTSFSASNKPKAISARRLAELKDTALYGLVMRAAYDFATIFKNGPVQGIAINGWISRNDLATGKFRSDVTMSLFATKNDLVDLNIVECDPKIAFKKLKGTVGSNPQDYTPIQPIYQLNEQDSRIVESREILSSIDEFENLGAMHWDDFEHLIREVFEMEFATNGAKVNVTRASRDSGVDAIVFDPDPIRGGKIVIQAKRYVNTVDVSAVRDLFGTVQNEGANKGILITTSGFGPDSFEFAKGKPLTLMNGQNLLWLLEKHGRKFVIDLPSARKVLKERGWL